MQRAKTAMMPPIDSEPVSPMKILAGLRLYGIKPMHAPASAATMSATFSSDTSSATTRMVTQLMVDTPTARPSSPSIRLTEFVMPTIHSTVSGMASHPRTMAS